MFSKILNIAKKVAPVVIPIVLGYLKNKGTSSAPAEAPAGSKEPKKGRGKRPRGRKK